MKFDPQNITIKPGHCARNWQSCDYFAPDGTELFHERTYGMRIAPKTNRKTLAQTFWLAAGEPHSVQWTNAVGAKDKIDRLAAKHGGHTMECFYSEGTFFLAFKDTEKAIAFCLTEDFDKHVLTMDKVEA